MLSRFKRPRKASKYYRIILKGGPRAALFCEVPIRQGNIQGQGTFSESSGGGRVVCSARSFLITGFFCERLHGVKVGHVKVTSDRPSPECSESLTCLLKGNANHSALNLKIIRCRYFSPGLSTALGALVLFGASG